MRSSAPALVFFDAAAIITLLDDHQFDAVHHALQDRMKVTPQTVGDLTKRLQNRSDELALLSKSEILENAPALKRSANGHLRTWIGGLLRTNSRGINLSALSTLAVTIDNDSTPVIGSRSVRAFAEHLHAGCKSPSDVVKMVASRNLSSLSATPPMHLGADIGATDGLPGR